MKGIQYLDQVLLTGIDRRSKVEMGDYEDFPFSCIGLIRFKDQYNQKAVATGCLISSCIALTSAHSFYPLQNETIHQLKPYQFYLGPQKSLNQEKAIKIIQAKVCPKYIQICKKLAFLDHKSPQFYETKKESQKYDYAIIKLQKNIKDIKRFPELVINTQSQRTKQKLLTVCGYTKVTGDQYYQYSHSNSMEQTQTRGLYDIDTLAGQSGSPVYYYDKNIKSTQPLRKKCLIAGVHKGYDPYKKLNVCTLISFEMVKQLQTWIQELNVTFKVTNLPQQNICLKQTQKQQQLIQLKQLVKSYLQKNKQLQKQIQSLKNGKAITNPTNIIKVANVLQEYKAIQLTQTQLKNLSHPQNPHNGYFRVQTTEIGAKITCLKTYTNYYNWIKAEEIEKGKKATFTIKITRTARYIFIGIATNAIIGKQGVYYNKQLIAYKSSGYLYQNTDRRDAGGTLNDGTLVKMTVDLNQWSIKWQANSQQRAVTTIPPIMQDKSLYLVIMMQKENDMIELLL